MWTPYHQANQAVMTTAQARSIRLMDTYNNNSIDDDDDDDYDGDNNNNNHINYHHNNNDTERRNPGFCLQPSHCAANCPQHVRSSGQSIGRLSCATCRVSLGRTLQFSYQI